MLHQVSKMIILHEEEEDGNLLLLLLTLRYIYDFVVLQCCTR